MIRSNFLCREVISNKQSGTIKLDIPALYELAKHMKISHVEGDLAFSRAPGGHHCVGHAERMG
jgi:hypothetical protein